MNRFGLKLWRLVIYGAIIVQPTAPTGIYGVVDNIANGHVATTILFLKTGRLARRLWPICFDRGTPFRESS
jgi:hypothetical protein